MKKLFEPCNIGSIEIKNRIVMPAMTTAFAGEDGAVTDKLVDYYTERARGGVGLIMTEATCVDHPRGKIAHATQLRVDRDKFIPGLSDLVDRVHRHDVKIACQLHHAGRQTNLEHTEGSQPVSASGVYDPVFRVTPKALEPKEIEDIIGKFAEGAGRAKRAGFDAVEIHGAHGYLVQQFFSAYTNRRIDEYGGNLDRRMAFALKILRQVKEKAGFDFPVLFRLSAEEHVEGGLGLNDTKKIAKRLQDEGVDALDISSGMDETPAEFKPYAMALPRGCLVHYASAIRRIVNVPIITVGRINDVSLAEEILQEHKADFIAMGRALIADPELPNKTREDRKDDIRKCTACEVCTMRIGSGLRLGCAINATVGEEKESRLERAAKPKQVLIVGGGPAGMEAARVLRLRGHEAILYEEGNELGGQLRLSTRPPHKEELKNILEFLSDQIKKLDIEIAFRRTVTTLLVQQIKPDTVVIATGAKPLIPNISGISRENVTTAWEVLAGKFDIGEEIVIAGGGTVGCETAELLAEMGKKVTIVEMLNNIALDAAPGARTLLLKRLGEKGVKTLVNSVITEITKEGLSIIDKDNSKARRIHAHRIVVALGAKPNAELFQDLKGKTKELYRIGDCVKPRKIRDAIYEGYHTARQI